MAYGFGVSGPYDQQQPGHQQQPGYQEQPGYQQYQPRYQPGEYQPGGYQPGGYPPGYPPADYPPSNYPPAGYTQWSPPPEPPPRRPGVLVAAGVLWLLNGAFLLVFGILTALADRLPGFEEAMRESGTQIGRDELLAVGIAGAVFGAAIIGLAVPVFTGATWARILITVVAVVPTAFLLVLVVFPLFTIAATVLQFLPQVSRYLQARRRRAAAT